MSGEAVDRMVFDMQLRKARGWLCYQIRRALERCFPPVMERYIGIDEPVKRARSAWPYVEERGWRLVCDPIGDESVLHFTWAGDFTAATKMARRRSVAEDVLTVQPLLGERIRKARSKGLEALIGNRWVVNESSGVLLRPLSAGEVMAMGCMPAIGETIEVFGERLGIVDGFEYGGRSWLQA